VTFILTIRVTVERFAPGVGAIPRTATTAIRIRND
jgi:hypothetical protein